MRTRTGYSGNAPVLATSSAVIMPSISATDTPIRSATRFVMSFMDMFARSPSVKLMGVGFDGSGELAKRNDLTWVGFVDRIE